MIAGMSTTRLRGVCRGPVWTLLNSVALAALIEAESFKMSLNFPEVGGEVTINFPLLSP